MITDLLTIASIHALALISPGPDLAIVLKNALRYSKTAAVFTALGIASGVCLHILYCLLGLSLIISKSTLIFNSIKISGALYLLYMAYKQISATPQHTEIEIKQNKTNLPSTTAFTQGFVCNALNPKASLYFLSLFTLVIKPETSTTYKLIFSCEIIILTFFLFCLIGMIISNSSVKIRLISIQHIINKIMGIILVFFALKLLFMTS